LFTELIRFQEGKGRFDEIISGRRCKRISHYL